MKLRQITAVAAVALGVTVVPVAHAADDTNVNIIGGVFEITTAPTVADFRT